MMNLNEDNLIKDYYSQNLDINDEGGFNDIYLNNQIQSSTRTSLFEEFIDFDIINQENNNNFFFFEIQDINNSGKSQDNNLVKKKRGRKSTNPNEKGVHDKFSEDIIIKRIKHKILEATKLFINKQILHIFNDKKFELLKIGYETTNEISVKMNQELLNTKLKNIFSKKISSKYKNYRFNHNEELVVKLIHNEKLKKYLT